MSDLIKVERAKYAFKVFCEALDQRNWKYNKDEEKLVISYGVNGEDLPMEYIVVFDIDAQIIRMLSPLSFKMSEEKRMDGVLAIVTANFKITTGSFDYDVGDGSIHFKMTQSFDECEIGKDTCNFMIDWSDIVVDKYNDKFLAINKGFLDVTQFVAEG